MTNSEISLKGAEKTYKNLKTIMKNLGQKYSIKVGIIGESAGQIHEGTELNNATLGAVHEFGATINHPGGQPYYINSSTGLAVFVSKNSVFGQYLIQKGQVTKPHTINIPARPFLGTLLNKDVKEYIYSGAELSGDDLELDKLIAEERSSQNGGYMEDLANIVAARALEMVQTAFSTGGYPTKWTPITQATRKHRKGDPDNPPLTDTGDLRDSITTEVKRVK